MWVSKELSHGLNLATSPLNTSGSRMGRSAALFCSINNCIIFSIGSSPLVFSFLTASSLCSGPESGIIFSIEFLPLALSFLASVSFSFCSGPELTIIFGIDFLPLALSFLASFSFSFCSGPESASSSLAASLADKFPSSSAAQRTLILASLIFLSIS